MGGVERWWKGLGGPACGANSDVDSEIPTQLQYRTKNSVCVVAAHIFGWFFHASDDFVGSTTKKCGPAADVDY